jgi:hypothetical protein
MNILSRKKEAYCTYHNVTHFQQDDHRILLDAIAHVEIDIFSY